MFKLTTFAYNIKQGLKTLFKSKSFSLAAIATMTACIFMFGIFYFVITNVQNMMKTAEKTVGITVFFDDNITYDEIVRIGDEIKKDSKVLSIEYKSAEQTWQEYREKYLSEELAKTFGEDNPLENSASYTVFTTAVEYQKDVTESIRMIKGVRQVNSAETLTETLQSVNKGVLAVSGVLIILLLSIATFLISITIAMGVSAHREEISIMKLIGATDYFVRGPYMVEGLVIGIIGSVIPLVLLSFAYDRVTKAIVEKFSSNFDMLTFLPASELFKALIPLSFLIGIGVSFLGSFLTLNRELRKID